MEMKHLTYQDFFGHGNDPCYGKTLPEWANFPPSTIVEILQMESIPASDRIWAFVHKAAGVDDRTLRLFACKCVRDTPLSNGRKVWDLLTDERSRTAVEVAEKFANGEATEDELDAAWGAAWGTAWEAAWEAAAWAAAWEAAREAAKEAAAAAAWVAAKEAAWEAQVGFALELLITKP